MEKIFFENSKGERICGVLHHPNKGSKHCVLIVHGFSSNKETSAKINAEILAEKNINSFRIDLDNAGESAPVFEEQSISKYKDTTLSAVQFLQSKDFENIHIIGTSFGGIVAVASAVEHDFSSIVLRAPVADYVELMKSRYGSELETFKQQGWFIYNPSRRGKLQCGYQLIADAEKYSGYELAKKITAPTLIIHGTADESVPLATSEKLVNCFPDAHLEIVDNATHLLGVDGDFSQSQKLLVNWFVEHTKEDTK